MDLKKSIREAKRRQILVISSISILTICIIFGIAIVTLDKISTKNYQKLSEFLFNHQEIASPNTQIDSQVISNSSIFGGEVVTNQSKNIDGYVMPWSSLRSKYSLYKNEIDYNELVPSWHSSSNNSYEYNRQTKQKIAKFYNPTIKDYYDGVKNELEDIEKLENHVAEVALSFDKPYTYSEVKKMMPENVNVVWLYLFSEVREEDLGPSGIPVYGFQLSMDEKNTIIDAEEDKESFFKAFESISTLHSEEIKTFIETNKDKSVDELLIWGVMVTGQTKNLRELKDKMFIRGSSIGVTAPIVPYITPEK